MENVCKFVRVESNIFEDFYLMDKEFNSSISQHTIFTHYITNQTASNEKCYFTKNTREKARILHSLTP